MVPRETVCTSCRELAEAVGPGMAERIVTELHNKLDHHSSEAVLHRACVCVVRNLECDRASVAVPVGRSVLRVVADSESAAVGDLIISLARYPEVAHVIAVGEPVVASSADPGRLLEPVSQQLLEAGIVGLAAVPLHLSGTVAVLRAISRTRPLSQSDLEVLKLVGHHVGHVFRDIGSSMVPEDPDAQLLRRMADGLIEVTLDGRIVAAEGPLLSQLGIEAETLLGRSIEEIIIADDAKEARRGLVELIEGEPARGRRVMSVSASDGRTVPIRLWGIRIEGLVPRAKIALRRVHTASGDYPGFEAFPLPLAKLTGIEQTIVELNPAAERLFGAQSDEMVGRSVGDLVREDRGRTSLTRADGSLVPVVTVTQDLPPTWRLMFLADISTAICNPSRERDLQSSVARQAEQIDRLQARLEDVEASRAAFLSASAHELKTPLTVVQSYLEILVGDLSEGLSTEQLSFLRICYDSVLRLRGLVTDLVDLAALKSGRVGLNIGRVAASKVLAGVFEEMRMIARRAEIRLENLLPNDLADVRGDPDRVRQVFWNLIDNAIKFTPPGGLVAVGASTEGDTVVLTVRDTGRGIHHEHLEMMFEEFHRFGDNSETRYRGSGLGLAICRRIIRALGGQITVESVVGRGSTFAVHLPRWPDEVNAPPSSRRNPVSDAG